MKEDKISLMSAILLNMNVLIGSAILIGPGRSAAVAGNASFLSWPLLTLLFLPLVLCTARLSQMFPGCGGFYAYAKEGINTTAGYLSGLLYVVGYTFAVVVEVVVIRSMMIAAFGNNWLLDNAPLFNALLVLVCVCLNAMSFKTLSTILGGLVIVKIVPLATLVALVPFVINPDFAVTTAEAMKIPQGLPFIIFGLWGFEYCCSLSHLIENSKRNAPLATIIGFLATVTLYTLFHFGALNLMGADNLAALGAASYAQFITLPIPYLKAFLTLLIPTASILVIFVTANGLMNSNIVMMHALAQERLFWKWEHVAKMSRVNRPWVALLIQGSLVFTMATLLQIDMIGNICNLAIAASFILPFLSLLLLQKRRNMFTSMVLTASALIITSGFSLYSWYGLGTTTSERLLGTVLFFGIVLFGYILYALRNTNPRNKSLDLSQDTPIHP